MTPARAVESLPTAKSTSLGARDAAACARRRNRDSPRAARVSRAHRRAFAEDSQKPIFIWHPRIGTDALDVLPTARLHGAFTLANSRSTVATRLRMKGGSESHPRFQLKIVG
ncbi:MAG: hypothetical protein IT563_08450 [Alphaproteobacteria bacterium]|nr:hypothetical protein [Alphaproteobacteria bacterium]